MAKTQKSSKKTFIIVAVIVLTLILIDFSPVGGNIRFYAKWIECGGRPVQTASWKGTAWYEPAPVFSLVRSKHWFCTPPFKLSKLGTPRILKHMSFLTLQKMK